MSATATASTAGAAVLAVRGALVAAARAGRTASPGEVSSAAYGAWVPRGLPRLLAEVARASRERGEPDLTCLVAHPRAPGEQHDDDLAAERLACWQRWGGRASSSPSSSSPSSSPSSSGSPGSAGAFAELGVLCPRCLVVVAPGGGCRCPATSEVGARFPR